MIVRKLRLQHGWSQEHLAQLSGLSVRTIQRVERGDPAGLETLKSLAAVFEVPMDELQQVVKMTTDTTTQATPNLAMSMEEQRAIEYVRDIKGFYANAISFAVIIPCLIILNVLVTPSYHWFWWVIFGWGIGLVTHGLTVFEFFSLFDANWEKKQVEKRLGRKL